MTLKRLAYVSKRRRCMSFSYYGTILPGLKSGARNALGGPLPRPAWRSPPTPAYLRIATSD